LDAYWSKRKFGGQENTYPFKIFEWLAGINRGKSLAIGTQTVKNF
jgi:hypothetical protein